VKCEVEVLRLFDGLRWWLHYVEMGKNSYSNSRYLWYVKVGDNVRISYNVHAQGKGVDFKGDRYDDGIVIKDGARVGYGVFIKHGVSIGKGAVVGANSVVLVSVPGGEVWAGNPARKVGVVG